MDDSREPGATPLSSHLERNAALSGKPRNRRDDRQSGGEQGAFGLNCVGSQSEVVAVYLSRSSTAAKRGGADRQYSHAFTPGAAGSGARPRGASRHDVARTGA